MATNSKFQYATWRTDKPKEDGFSQELVSKDSQVLIEKGATLDDLYALPYEGVDTLYAAMKRNVDRIPDHALLGTQVTKSAPNQGGARMCGGSDQKPVVSYEWMTHKECSNVSENIGYGLIAHELCPLV